MPSEGVPAVPSLAPPSEALAALHARCFVDAPPPWSAVDFTQVLALPSTRLVSAPEGFAVLQVAGPVAEILTIAVDPGHRGRGHGRALIAAAETLLVAEGAEEILLEVAETNPAGRALYAAAGFVERGRRRGYYRRAGATAIDALVLAKALDPGDRAAPPRGRDPGPAVGQK